MSADPVDARSSTFVVIVNYRTGDLVVDCLASLVADLPELRGGRVIVVDNASGDGSAGVIRAAIERHGWSGWAEVVEMPRNGGFAYGNNAGVRRVRELDPAYSAVVMLNPDTTVKPGSIACLAAFLRSRPDAGIAGALIENEHGYCMTSAHADPSPLGELHGAAQFGLLSRWPLRRIAEQQTAEPRRCDWVSGACMVVRREVLESVGPLDEGYFLYFEEVDYCVRARRQGWSCWFVPAARVIHFEGAATGIRLARRRRPAYWYASRRRFFVKCYGALGLLLADFLWAIGRLTLVVRRALRLGGRSGQNEEPARFAFDLLAGDFGAFVGGELRQIPRGR